VRTTGKFRSQGLDKMAVSTSELSPHIVITLELEHVIPSQDWPHGSPFCEAQFVSCDGEFKVVYKVLRAVAE
jgi:hypothetical protein